jgi:branched-chain amino acid transport system ATP-binding protein
MAVPQVTTDGGATSVSAGVAALSVQSLEAAYAGAPALRGITLTVPLGSAVALLGGNGAGKTTTIRAVTGLLGKHRGSITAGEVRIGGELVSGLRSDQVVKRRVAHVPEGRLIFGGMSIEENLLIGAAGRQTPGKADTLKSIYEMFPVLGQRKHSAGGLLSGGEQQMLAIGRALMADPTLILLDEISLGLAPLITRSIFESLARIRTESKVSMLIVEQNAKLALEFCDYGYILENGRILHEGPADQLQDDPQVQELYLGGDPGESNRSFAEAKRFRRRQRWLS